MTTKLNSAKKNVKKTKTLLSKSQTTNQVDRSRSDGSTIGLESVCKKLQENARNRKKPQDSISVYDFQYILHFGPLSPVPHGPHNVPPRSPHGPPHHAVLSMKGP